MTTMDIKYVISQQANQGAYQVYIISADLADTLYTELFLGNQNQYLIGTPANPSMNVFSTLSGALSSFLSVVPAQTVTAYNSLFGTSNTVGNFVTIDTETQNAINGAALPVYNGSGTVISGAGEYVNTVNVSGGSGNATFYLTHDGTATGTALFPNAVDFAKAEISDNTKGYNYSYALTNSNRTLTVTANYFAPVTILGISVLLATTTAAANATPVNILVKGH